jgi:cellulose synthase/poly-beta-1,6-N-acetylglucosamine synthase-like glycosyltransferase
MILAPLYFAALALLCLYGAHRCVLVWLYFRHAGRRAEPVGRFATPPRVLVQLPMFNERYVAERLIAAAAALDWPRERLEIQVLDDSTDDTGAIAQAAVDRLSAAGVPIVRLARSDRSGFKAGALAAGLARCDAELVAVFDADFVPDPDFLTRTVDFFTEPEVGMVQVRWGHLNRRHSLLTRAQAAFLDGHFLLESCARFRSGRLFNFNGTAGIWRRAAIEDAGGWQHDTLTEDLDLSYRAQLRGWRFVFVRDPVCPGELPVEMNGFKSQQHRWAKGGAQTARKLLPAILASRLPAALKLEAFFHLTNNVAAALFLAVCFLRPSGLTAGRGLDYLLRVDVPILLLATVSTCSFYLIAQREAGVPWRQRLALVPVLVAAGVGMSLNNARAVLEGLFGGSGTFVRTPKYGVTEHGETAPAGASAARSSRRGWLDQRAYHRAVDGWTLLEAACAVWFSAALGRTAAHGDWLAAVFYLLIASGFGYVALLSLLQTRRRRIAHTLAPAPAA